MLVLKLEHGAARVPALQAGAHATIRSMPPHEPSFLPLEPLVAHLVASLIVATLLAGYFSRPIRTLRAAFQTAATGNLAVGVGPVVEKRHDELSDLLDEFDRMASQLHALMESQRRLLHDVSHEVRSPLARMQVAIGLARQQPRKTDTLLNRIEREIFRIDRLVEELLTLAKLDTSESDALEEEVCIDAILADIMDSAQFEAQADGKSFHMSGQCRAVVMGNPELLHRAIENIVRNAIRHTRAGSRVALTTQMDTGKQSLTMSISDHGPGVPDAELDAIFEPFFRGSSQDGHGLGLAIAAKIMKMHRASMRAANLPEGGFCVEIAIPVSRLERTRAAVERGPPA
jgi:two-component system OmpR family sensor kinase